ncbi:hypothetical protein D3C72_2356960 [compost metagenome]
MQANCVTNYQKQRRDQQNGQPEDKAVAQFENGCQAFDPDQIKLRHIHLGQLRKALAQGFKGRFVNFCRSYHDHTR